VRARFTPTILVALGALAIGALTIVAGLAVSDADKWPGWLRPYHSWGWPAVWVLLAAFVVLAVWQYTHPPSPPAGEASSSVRGEDSGPVAAGGVTISGGQGPTAGRNAHTVTGGTGPTAGRDIITIITDTAGPLAPGRNPAVLAGPAAPEARPGPAETSPPAEDGLEEGNKTHLPSAEDDLRALEELKPLLHESVYVRFQERILFRRFPHLRS
jgi:hypothetical protein